MYTNIQFISKSDIDYIKAENSPKVYKVAYSEVDMRGGDLKKGLSLA